MRLRGSDRRLHRLGKLSGRVGFLEESGQFVASEAHGDLGLAETAGEDNRKVGPHAPQRRQRLRAAHDRHREVQNYDIHIVTALVEQIDRRTPVLRFHHTIAEAFQRRPAHTPDHFLVVDQENRTRPR